jgi:hypothetical protein
VVQYHTRLGIDMSHCLPQAAAVVCVLWPQAAAAVKKVDSSIDSGHHGVAARLLFAHCETLVPLATLLGLFEPDLPPPPPVTAGLKKQGDWLTAHVAATCALILSAKQIQLLQNSAYLRSAIL